MVDPRAIRGAVVALIRGPAARRFGRGLVLVGVVFVWGTLGYVAQGWPLFDAVYMVVITVSTVGFTEVRQVEGAARLHTIVLIGMGTLVVTYFIGSFLSFFTEGELQRLLGIQHLRRRLLNITDHVVIVGFGRMGSLIAQELKESGVEFVIIEQDPALIAEIRRREYLFVHGDATEEAVLSEARLEHAQALVTAVASDADSVFITLTARQLAPEVTIIARAELPATQRKLMQAGANHVVLTAAIGARRIASLLRNPNTVEFVELVTRQSELDLVLEEVPIEDGDRLVDQTLRHADIGRRTGVMVIAIKPEAGAVQFPPPGDAPLRPGDSIVLLGRRAQLNEFREAYCPEKRSSEAHAP